MNTDFEKSCLHLLEFKFAFLENSIFHRKNQVCIKRIKFAFQKNQVCFEGIKFEFQKNQVCVSKESSLSFKRIKFAS